MNELLLSKINGLEKSFDIIEQETPSLKPILKAFKELLISRAVVKSSFPERTDIYISPPDCTRLADGYPSLTAENIISFVDPWGDSVKSVLQSLLKTFASIKSEILTTEDAFERESVNLKYCISSLVEDREEDINTIANQLGFNPIVLKFILGQILKPFVEKRTEELRPIIRDLPWHKGYCPICGASPELSFLKGEEGQRYLKCSLCGYDWRFDRMTCPYCGENRGSKEFMSVYGFEHEWVEFCPDCHKYIVGIDLRKQKGITTDVAAIGMVHLDIIAQRKGFLPIAQCAWNIVLPDN